MKLATLKTTLVTGSFLLAAGQTGIAAAHDIYNASLGNARKAKDIYKVTCSTLNGNVTDHLAFAVEDAAPVAPPVVKIVVTKGGVTVKGSDPSDNAGGPGPEKQLQGGNGEYKITIKKSKEGEEIYHLVYHCESASGIHTGTDIEQTKNQ